LLSFKEGESVEDFAMHLNNLTNQLATLGMLSQMTRSSTSIFALPAQGISSLSSLLEPCWIPRSCQ
jgi:hypothetical protein